MRFLEKEKMGVAKCFGFEFWLFGSKLIANWVFGFAHLSAWRCLHGERTLRTVFCAPIFIWRRDQEGGKMLRHCAET